MSMLEEYRAYARAREALRQSAFSEIWFGHEGRYVHPFRLFGNVWYVGDSWVCVHLVDTGDGLLLIDSGCCGATALLVQSIWEAGFSPADVRWIIHSHGHMDHIGGARYFREMYGTKLLLGGPDAAMFRERPELSLIQTTGNCCDALFTPDVEVWDGDRLRFGSVEIQFRLVPGHTEGCLAMFFDAVDGDDVKRCGYYGGFGFNTLERDYLDEIGDREGRMRRVYLESLAKVRDERVEIFLGNHTDNNQTLERRQRMLERPEAPNPFIDDRLWRRFLDGRRDALLEMMAREAE